MDKGFADEIIEDEKPRIITNAMIGKLSVTDEMIAKAKAEIKAKDEEKEKQDILEDLDMYGI